MNWKAVIVLALLAMIGRARVAVAPGWVVPLPVLIVAALVIVCAAVVAVVALHAQRGRLVALRPAEPVGEVA